jgi:threonine dehydrogenase-like Zn-dependent dehydrogenase
LLTLQVAQSYGVTRIYATDTDPDRRTIGQEFGVQVIDPLTEDVAQRIQTDTSGEGVDAAIDAVGLETTRQECIEAVARSGRVIFVGLHDEESTIQSNLVIRNEIALKGSFAYAPVDFMDGLTWLAGGSLRIDPWLIKVPLAEGRDCFERLLSKPGPVAKILLYA